MILLHVRLLCVLNKDILLLLLLLSSAKDTETDPPRHPADSVDENQNVSANTNHNSNTETAIAAESKPDDDCAEKYYASRSSAKKNKRLSVKTIELAIDCCQKHIDDLEHGDLDVHDQVFYLLTKLTGINNQCHLWLAAANRFMWFIRVELLRLEP